jgi:hypothetical protein
MNEPVPDPVSCAGLTGEEYSWVSKSRRVTRLPGARFLLNCAGVPNSTTVDGGVTTLTDDEGIVVAESTAGNPTDDIDHLALSDALLRAFIAPPPPPPAD